MREMRSADTGVERIDLTTDYSSSPQQTIIGSGNYDEEEETSQAKAERKVMLVSA